MKPGFSPYTAVYYIAWLKDACPWRAELESYSLTIYWILNKFMDFLSMFKEGMELPEDCRLHACT